MYDVYYLCNLTLFPLFYFLSRSFHFLPILGLGLYFTLSFIPLTSNLSLVTFAMMFCLIASQLGCYAPDSVLLFRPFHFLSRSFYFLPISGLGLYFYLSFIPFVFDHSPLVSVMSVYDLNSYLDFRVFCLLLRSYRFPLFIFSLVGFIFSLFMFCGSILTSH